METLKPCPFCGGTDVFLASPNAGITHHVECNNQDCVERGPVRIKAQDAIDAWNKRTPAQVTSAWPDRQALIDRARVAGEHAQVLPRARLKHSITDLLGVIAQMEKENADLKAWNDKVPMDTIRALMEIPGIGDDHEARLWVVLADWLRGLDDGKVEVVIARHKGEMP